MEVIFTKNVQAFSRDQANCPYKKGVGKERFDCIYFFLLFSKRSMVAVKLFEL